jgi:hypothetical protein
MICSSVYRLFFIFCSLVRLLAGKKWMRKKGQVSFTGRVSGPVENGNIESFRA